MIYLSIRIIGSNQANGFYAGHVRKANRNNMSANHINSAHGKAKILSGNIRNLVHNKKMKCSHFATFDASGRIFLFVASSAVDFLFARDKRLRSDGILANATRETFFMPLSCLVLHFFRACLEEETKKINKTKITQKLKKKKTYNQVERQEKGNKFFLCKKTERRSLMISKRCATE